MKKNRDLSEYKPRLRSISGCRYTPRQRREFRRKMLAGQERAGDNAWQNEWISYAERLTTAMK